MTRYDFSHVHAGLKDFQRATVDYLFERLYGDRDQVSRFLVADEVGLGKTLVAKGLIARAIEHLQDTVERIDIVYVCSNADIARQNIARLNVTGQDELRLPSRITLLPTRLHELNAPDPDGRAKVNFVSFTPGTSFDLGNRGGRQDERVLLRHLLERAWGSAAVKGAGTINALRVTTEHKNFRDALREFDPTDVDEGLANGFITALRAHDRAASRDRAPTLEERFADLRARMTRARNRRAPDDKHDQLVLLGELRRLLARSCVEALEPDLVILDEFQRFRDLLDRNQEAGELAHDLFDYAEARVVLLSATPYKMYTVADDVTDDHYADFLRTLRFLFGDDEDKVAAFKRELRSYRELLLGGAALDLAVMRRRRGRVERELRRVMVRTERLAATPDRNGMLVERLPETRLTTEDVRSYVALDQLTRTLDGGDVLEYWKSTPYLVSFMEDYKLGQAVARAADDGRWGDLVRVGDAANIDWKAHESYRPLDAGNPRMQALFDEVIATEVWKLLWIAPSLPYYELGGPYRNAACAEFTKRLVFSAWAAVPRAIAALTSYEAERRIMRPGRGRAPVNTAAGRERIKPLLRLARNRGRVTGMPVLGLIYPSPALARLADPFNLAASGNGDRPADSTSVLQRARASVSDALAPIVRGRSGPADPRWYWAAPLLLDDLLNAENTDWLQRWDATYAWTGVSDHSESAALGAHVSVALELIDAERDGERSDLGTPPTDLVDVLALSALAGPGNCALRSLACVDGRENALEDDDVRDAAARVAWGLRSLFNQPHATYLVRSGTTRYWQRVLEYSFDGCLQAVLDEYTHLLVEWTGVADLEPPKVVRHVGDTVYEALSLRRVAYGVREVDLGNRAEPIRRRSMGGRFALRFGDERSDDGGETRRSHVRTAFNSPFWPFVLATTSVGQEGLDFHLYCHAVVHWNLPANPVDLEQREGRVHRYKGHAVRRNLARALGTDALRSQANDPWAWMFEEGARRRPRGGSDIVPLWVYTDGDARIERIVPTLPLSRERSRLEALKRSLVAYRLAFGQPRQEELVSYLQEHFSSEEIERLKVELHINLAPKTRR
jgi:hypothetical protein